MVGRVDKKFNSWLGVTLIKASLSSIQMYYMSLFKMLKSVAKRTDKIQRNFLWHGLENWRKIHLVKWKDIYKPLEEGGLGIRRIVDS